jgi:rhamnosyltransferase
MNLSIVVRAYNEAEHIERLMIGIGAQTVTPREVILVDSGSTDDTVAIARAYGARVVEVDSAEFTFGRALNKGCDAATGEICVFPSAHVYPVRTTWLEHLVEPLLDDRVVLSYGRQRGNETSRFSEHQILAQWFPAQSVCPQTTHFCNNANCAIRRSVWESMPYDETLPGLEDIAWAKAAQADGGWIAYAAEAEVIHVHDEAWEQVRNRYRREAMAMRSIDHHAHFTRSDFASLFARNVVSDMRAALSHGALRREFGSILRFRYNQLAGTYRGFNGPSAVSAELRERFYYPGEHGRAHHLGGDAPDAIDYPALEATRRVARDSNASGPPASEDGAEDTSGSETAPPAQSSST